MIIAAAAGTPIDGGGTAEEVGGTRITTGLMIGTEVGPPLTSGNGESGTPAPPGDAGVDNSDGGCFGSERDRTGGGSGEVGAEPLFFPDDGGWGDGADGTGSKTASIDGSFSAGRAYCSITLTPRRYTIRDERLRTCAESARIIGSDRGSTAGANRSSSSAAGGGEASTSESSSFVSRCLLSFLLRTAASPFAPPPPFLPPRALDGAGPDCGAARLTPSAAATTEYGSGSGRELNFTAGERRTFCAQIRAALEVCCC